MSTQLIHIANTPPKWRTNPEYVFIGKFSSWMNPYSGGSDKTNLEKYEKYLRNNTRLINRFYLLNGKTLVCNCKRFFCHGEVLLKLIKERYPEETNEQEEPGEET